MQVLDMLSTRMFHKICMLFIVISCSSCFPVGYDTQPTREALIRFPYTGAESGGNTVLGFAALDGGFIVADQTQSFTFNSFYPINSIATFNGGTVYLLESLNFTSMLEVVSTGTFIGNSNSVYFMPRQGSLRMTVGGQQFSMLNSQALTNVTTTRSVDWFGDTYVLIGCTAAGANNRLRVYQRSGNSLTLLGGIQTTLNLNQAAWYPVSVAGPAYYVASANTATSGLIPYKYTAPNTWVTGTAIEGTNNVLSIAWNPISPFDIAIARAALVGTHAFNSATGQFTSAYQSSQAMTLTPSVHAMSWDTTGTYLAIGGVNAAIGRVLIYSYVARALSSSPLVTLDFTGTTAANTVCWSPDNTMLAVGTSGGTQNLRIFSFNGSSLTEITSYQVGETSNVTTIDWQGNFLAYGRSSVSQEIRVFYVDAANQKLLLNYEYTTGTSITVPSLAWSKGSPLGVYLATFDSAPNLNLYNYSSLPLIFNSVDLTINNTVTLNNSLRVQGSCTVNLNGNSLDLNGNSISIEPGGSLTIENAIIRNVTGTNIVCSNNTSSLTLTNCTLILSGNTQFNTGALHIYGLVVLTGQYIYTYSSTQQCTIHSNAKMFFDAGMTFRYSAATQDRINMENRFATLYLYQTTLDLPNSLRLINGTLTIEGQCPINATGGLYFGNNVLLNNILINVLPESGLLITGGTVYNQNV